jgi:hypothetical protein
MQEEGWLDFHLASPHPCASLCLFERFPLYIDTRSCEILYMFDIFYREGRLYVRCVWFLMGLCMATEESA